jgi:hypothetical protein
VHAPGEESALWLPDRPHTLVVACSDGRLQEATDDFLGRELDITRYDRFYLPGGGGALAASGRDFIRARRMREECRYLIELHGVTRVILLFHGPADGGPIEAACADYRRKLPVASAAGLRGRQAMDAEELLARVDEWCGPAAVIAYRLEVHRGGAIAFAPLGTTPRATA